MKKIVLFLYFNVFPVFLKKIFGMFVYPNDPDHWDFRNGIHCYRYLVNNTAKKKIINKIAVVIPNATLFYHFEPIIRHLDKNSFFCLPMSSKRSDHERIMQLISKHKFPFLSANHLLKNQKKAALILSNSVRLAHNPTPERCELLEQLGEVQVRMMYSGGKIDWNTSEWNKIYHHILVYGPFYKNLFEKKFRNLVAHEVGYPRLDGYFIYKDNLQSLYQKMSFNPRKKTICFLPTHGEFSSIDLILKMLPFLDNYNVILKPHPFIKIGQDLSAYNHVYFIGGQFNNVECFAIADFIVSDYGGSVLAAIYCNKNLLLIDTPAFSKVRNTLMNSPEDIVFDAIGSHNITDVRELIKLIEDNAYFSNQLYKRKKLANKFFMVSAQSGLLAANTIREIYQKESMKISTNS